MNKKVSAKISSYMMINSPVNVKDVAYIAQLLNGFNIFVLYTECFENLIKILLRCIFINFFTAR